MIQVETGREDLYDKSFLRYEDPKETLCYKNTQMTVEYALNLFENAKGVSAERVYELAVNAHETIPMMTRFSAKQLMKAEHNGQADIFLENYRLQGNIRCGETPNNTEDLDRLKELFAADRRFKGRVPQIVPMIAAMMEYYRENGVRRTPEEIVQKFRLNTVRALIDSGIPKPDAVNLFCFLNPNQLDRMVGKQELCEMTSALIAKGLDKKNKSMIWQAVWMADHPDTNIETLREIYDNRKNLDIRIDMTVEAVQTALSNLDNLGEVKKVEKAYKKCGFRLSDCVCLLKDHPTETGKYRGRILDGTDPMQVMLGHFTDCCQVLGNAGETSMMYGLVHDTAGFFVLENKNTGRVYAQAEAWEFDPETLVLDNIEFANDAEIDQYKEAFGEYLLNSPYKNIIMGCGYNGLSCEARGQLESAPEVTPPVTARDIYILSWEDDAGCPGRTEEEEEELLCIPSVEKAQQLLDSGKATYYDYLYSDVDDNKGTVYLKHDYRISEYFGIENDRQTDAAKEMLRNGSTVQKFALYMLENNDKLQEYAEAKGNTIEDEGEER